MSDTVLVAFLLNKFKPIFLFEKSSKDAKFVQCLSMCVPFAMNKTDAPGDCNLMAG